MREHFVGYVRIINTYIEIILCGIFGCVCKPQSVNMLSPLDNTLVRRHNLNRYRPVQSHARHKPACNRPASDGTQCHLVWNRNKKKKKTTDVGISVTYLRARTQHTEIGQNADRKIDTVMDNDPYGMMGYLVANYSTTTAAHPHLGRTAGGVPQIVCT